MKKLIVLFLLVAGFSAATKADVTSVSEYVLNEATVEQLFDASEDVTFQISGGLTQIILNLNRCQEMIISNLLPALWLWPQWITGIGAIIPIHRFILGTDGKGFKIFCMYFCTIKWLWIYCYW
jgi:hypothetical protein